MKKLIISMVILTLFAGSVQANQRDNDYKTWDGKSSVSKEVLTLKPEINFRPSRDPDTGIELIIIHKIQLVDGEYDNGKIIIDIEVVDNEGNHSFKTCEKNLKGGNGYYYQIITEEKDAKGIIK